MMLTKKRRVFLAVPCSQDLQNFVLAYQSKWNFLPVRWIKPEHLHLTLIPPTYVSDDELIRRIEAVRKAVGSVAALRIVLDRFMFAPPAKPPRMIWLAGPANYALQRLKEKAETAWGSEPEQRPLLPHITIARMREHEWRRYEPKPNVEERVEFEMRVAEIAVMESILRRSGAEYAILERILLAT